MKEIKIKLDYSHGPIWKEKFDVTTGEWSTGIDIIDNDAALQILNNEAERIYTSLYVIDDNNKCTFRSDLFEAQKSVLLSIIQTIIARLNELNNGAYIVIDEETKNLQRLVS